MSYTVTLGDFDALETTWTELMQRSATDTVFLTPRWQRLWWKHFGEGAEQLMFELRLDGKIVGLAPMYLQGGELSLLGNTQVCDFSDFVLPAEHCTGALNALFAHLDTLT